MTDITIGGEVYAVPDLPLGVIRRTAKIATRLDELSASGSPTSTLDESLDLAIELVLAWLKPAYPKLTAEIVEAKMTINDVARMGRTVSDVMNGSGIETVGEFKAPPATAVRAPAAAKRKSPPSRSVLMSSSTESSRSSSRRAAKVAPGA